MLPVPLSLPLQAPPRTACRAARPRRRAPGPSVSCTAAPPQAAPPQPRAAPPPAALSPAPADGAAAPGVARRRALYAATAAFVVAGASGLLALASSGGGSAAAPQAAALPDRPADDSDILSDFSVSFLNRKVDHRVLVELVVAGQTVGFVGALVAGLAARERKEETERLNRKLVALNKQLRESARVRPPPPSPAAAAAAPPDGPESQLLGMLRGGKALLKSRDGAAARAVFEDALRLARSPAAAAALEAPWRAERKALRGVGAAAQLQGDHAAALEALQRVLAMSEVHGDRAGAADVVGVIADVYTEAGDFQEAGRWYDRYIRTLAE